MNRTEIRSWLLRRLAEHVGIPADRIDTKQPLAWYGLGSAQVVELSGELESWLGRRVPPTVVFEHPTIDALAAHLSGETLPDDPQPATGFSHEPIAVIGIGCRFPGARGRGAFWQLLREGRDAIREVPRDRWDAAAFYDPDPARPGKANTRWGAFMEGIDAFDANFFGISPAEAARMDPQQRMLLEVSWEALEDAGVVAERLAGSATGVFIGISTNEYSHQFVDASQIDARAGTGNALSIAANRISYTYDLRGPSVALDTACSSSLVAVHLACRSLRSGESTLALAGGASLMLSPALSISFTKAGIMSPDGRCKTFDAEANGYTRGEGVGVVVLKRLSQALADRDPIAAVIRGSAVNQDGKSNGLMAPNPRAQEAVLRAAHRDAGSSPADVQYVEAHGTGTFLGDPIEAKAIGRALAPGRTTSCAIGSVKTNIGHLEAAAGIAGLIKVALCLEHRELVPSLNFREVNPQIPLFELRLEVQTERSPWPQNTGPRLAGVSAFGFGGTNAHVVLCEAPARPAPAEEPTSRPELLVLSAMAPAALTSMAASWATALRAGVDLPATVRTAALKRTHHHHRMAVVGRSVDELAGKLDIAARSGRPAGVVTGRAPVTTRKLAFVFSGQGSQWPAMGAALLADEPVARRAIEEIDERIRARAGWSVIDALLDPSPERMRSTQVAQPSIFAVQIALARLWRSWGVEPDAVVGHSVGEIAAAEVAGALSLDRAVSMVVERGRIMQRSAGTGEMAVIGLDAEQTAQRLEGRGDLEIAALNGPRTTVVAGPRASVEALARSLEEEGAWAAVLGLDFAFHCRLLDPFLSEWRQALDGLEVCRPAIPMISTVTGDWVTSDDLGIEHWVRNMRQPVRFAPAIDRFVATGFDLFVELGPDPLHRRGIRDVLETAGKDGDVLASLERHVDVAAPLPYTTLGALFAAGREVDLAALHADRGATVSGLPSYPFEAQRHWLEADSILHEVGHGGAHPILGWGADIAAQAGLRVWSSQVSLATLPYLADHRVRSVPVFPAAAYVEAALAAALEVWPSVEVRNLNIGEVLRLDGEDRELQFSFDHERRHLKVHSRRVGRHEPWVQNAEAELAHGTGETSAQRVELTALRQRCGEKMQLGALYRALEDRGLEYGPRFRGVESVWAGEQEAVGRVVLPASIVGEAPSYRIHPAFLDACLHVLAAARAGAGGEALYVPTRIETVHFEVPSAPLERGWSHAEVTGEDADGFVGNVRIFDDDGRLVLGVQGIGLRRLGRASVAAAADLHSYRVAWRAIARPPVPGRTAPGRWLILADRGSAARAAERALTERGDAVIRVEVARAGEAPIDGARIDLASAGVLRALIARLNGPGQPPLLGVLHFWSLDASTEDLDDAQRVGAASVLEVCKALALASAATTPRLCLFTRAAQPVDQGAPLATAGAPLWGLLKVVAFELPELRVLAIDLAPEASEDEGQAIVAAVLEDGDENQQAFRRGERFVPRLDPYALRGARDASSGGPPRIRDDGSYLITGGLGALGLLVAERLVQRGAKMLWLIGRSAPSEATGLVLDRLRKTGATIRVAQVDVADREALAGQLTELRADAPPLRGLVHAAGVIDDGALLDLDEARMAAVMAPKVAGAWNLHLLTQREPLDFFAMFSSAVSVMGSPGQGNYAAANAFLDLLAHDRRARGLPGLSVAWGPWAEVGMAAETAERMEKERELTAHLVKMIPPPQGLDLLERLMGDDEPSVLVLPYDVRNLIQFFPEGSGVSLFAEVLREDLQAQRTASGTARIHPRPQLAQDYVAPRDEMEAVIAALWQRALTIEPVGVLDNFFELGGDSVFAGQIVSQVNKRFGVSIGLEEAFQALTIEQVAEGVRRRLVEKVESLSEEEAALLLAKGDRT